MQSANEIIETEYFKTIRQKVAELGGFMNAHLHIDRSGTFNFNEKNFGNEYALSLKNKHALIPLIHESHEYDKDNLQHRVYEFLEDMISLNTTRADSFVDVTDDRVKLEALDSLNELKTKISLDFRLGAYSPLGFRDDEPKRWRLIEEASKKADFLGALPERDSKRDYSDHIGFKESVIRFLDLSNQIKKPLHIHVDQRNDPRENGSEIVIDLMDRFNYPINHHHEPNIWLVHVISPSLYDEKRFQHLIEKIKALNIGVICCPSAAISMRQLRSIRTPTFNSIARILDMLAAGIHVRIGSDNIFDITSPAGTIDLIDEIFVLSNALRFYDQDIMAKLGAGQKITEIEIEKIKSHLEKDVYEIEKSIESYYPD